MVYKFSPSSLSLLKECERCFWLQFNWGIKRPASIFPSLPSGMDRILKEHFDVFRARNSIPPELRTLPGVKLFDDVNLLQVWRSNFKGIQWKDAEGNLIGGAIDNLLVKDGKFIILDYKTRGYAVKEDTHAHYQDQMDMYAFLFLKNGYAVMDYAYLLFYHPLKVHENGDVDFHKHLVKVPVDAGNAERIFAKALRVLKGPLPSFGEECGHCAWLKLCAEMK